MPYNYYSNPYMPTGYTPYYQRPLDNFQPINRQVGIQGKTVDNIEVVKAIDIPLDGSTSYFPLADGSAIVSKQLQQDGTSRVIVYKPVIGEPEKAIKYVTENDLEAIKKEKEDLKKQIPAKVGEQ